MQLTITTKMQEAFLQAAMKGVPQITHYADIAVQDVPDSIWIDRGNPTHTRAYCAIGLLSSKNVVCGYAGAESLMCPACEHLHIGVSVGLVLVHLNNNHRWTWLDFARKLPILDE